MDSSSPDQSLAVTEASAPELRRRIGGTVWEPSPMPAEAGPVIDISRIVPDESHGPRRRKRRRKKQKRRAAYIGIVAMLLLGVLVGSLAYRTNQAISTVQRVSTPPPVVEDATNPETDDPLPVGITIDTGPAQEAIAEAENPGLGTPTVVVPVASDDDGLLGGVRDAADNAGDLASGAAIAAGITDPASEAITLLVMGVDARPGSPIDVGVRPDVLMAVRLDPETQTCRVLSIPRDTRVELPGYGLSKINHALMIGGIPYQMLVTSRLLGISFDHYALLDFQAFEQIVSEIGAITVVVPDRVTINGVLLEPGPHTLDAQQALAFARYRDYETDGDIGRVRRQWALLHGVASALNGRDIASDATKLLPVIEDHLRTDLSPADIAAIAKVHGATCTSSSVETLILDGQRVLDTDPILGIDLFYNDVTSDHVRRRVSEFLGETPKT